MNIILVTGAKARARTITFDWSHWTAGSIALCSLFIAVTLAFNFATLKWAAAVRHPWLQAIVLADQREAAQKIQQRMRAHLNAMAMRLGELQAQVARLDGLGERLAKTAGLKPQDLPGGLSAGTVPGRGGAPSSLPPVADIWYSSSFGYRIDPFTGQNAFHEGVDFPADAGTPVVAAASGKVVFAGEQPQYGKMVEIDHGNGLVTRYAHASQLNVRDGDLVLRGQRVATVGSTGRSTGPHLHFEVRLNGVPQNPARFLRTTG